MAERGVSFDELAESAGRPGADALTLRRYRAFNAPLRTCRERERARTRRKSDVTPFDWRNFDRMNGIASHRMKRPPLWVLILHPVREILF